MTLAVMATPALTTHQVRFPDDFMMAVHEMGSGPPVLLLHGLFSDAQTNWVRFGHAAKLASAGLHVWMPDFRGHGQSKGSGPDHGLAADVLADDIELLIEHLGLEDFDLGGFSLGARTTAKLLARGVRPRRAILAGMGWQGLSGWGNRQQFFIDAIDSRDTVKRGDPHWMAVQFMKTTGVDPVVARALLSGFAPIDMDRLLAVDVPILVVCGTDDQDNGSAPELAERLPGAHYAAIPGTHMSSVTEGALGDEMVSFLTA